MSILSELTKAAQVLHEAGKIEQYNQILEAQKELLHMQEIISSLKDENKDLKQKLKNKESVFFENNSYWINQNDKKDGPFCTRCLDVESLLVRMQPCGNPAYYDCKNCENRGIELYPQNNIVRNQLINKNKNRNLQNICQK